MKLITTMATLALLWGSAVAATPFDANIRQAFADAGYSSIVVQKIRGQWIVTAQDNGVARAFVVDKRTGVSTPIDVVPVSDDGPNHDAGDDHGVHGAGHDVGDDHGVHGAGHDAGDDHGVHGAGHDAGDDHGVHGAGHDAGDDHGVHGAGHDGGDDHGRRGGRSSGDDHGGRGRHGGSSHD